MGLLASDLWVKDKKWRKTFILQLIRVCDSLADRSLQKP